ncbi:MAG TPA: M23 family metallopeptidase [Cyclobacteriaceae bacterium]|nr:M23 family metallopeptidase [Cyclobacteriaceae bacterium]HMV09974.1 M23 family metallopeptidase [Cyclobacteriaceae bacterium]HMV89812.1 M23 family metallopeptidase [Cyclobacteriaceae bacterium]HMX01587.1 M23 family metallopeptidase [Cyclobacteriaceae bacterium]HMX50719.1 M23 family metallopeptidase [Cyclobacteriaceae bacterium]
MARIKYYYDTETCKYERVKTKKTDIILNMLGILALTGVMALSLIILYYNFFDSPKEIALKNRIKELEYYYDLKEKEVQLINEAVDAVAYRDDNIYRIVLGAEPIDKNIRNAGVGGADRYADIRDKNLIDEDMIVALSEKVDKLKRKVYIELKSQDELRSLAEKKVKLFAAIPAIQPISNKQLVALASGFGVRIHPIYKVKKMHTGIDFAAPIGTPIYATADGKVEEVSVKFSGYGKMVVLDHGFGYKTRYAHMHDFAVRTGQNIKRGELIGYVGDTGVSTAPHLHYEVMLNGVLINPVHYFFNDLSPDEYEKIVELSSIENQSLGM